LEPFLKDILNKDLGLMTAYKVFYELIDSGLKDKYIECPIDYIEDKKGRVFGGVKIAVIVVVVVVVIIVICCCKKKD